MRRRAFSCLGNRAEDAGVGLAVDETLIERLLALVDAHDVGWIGVLGKMRIIGRDPGDATEVDAERCWRMPRAQAPVVWV